MTDKEQIEEMVKTIVDREKRYVIGETQCKKCNLNKCDLHCNIHSDISYDCEVLYNAGYRKGKTISYQAMIDSSYIDRINQLEARLDTVRKETAEEILQTLYNYPHEYHESKIKELAKQYGVDVEE